MKFFDLFAHKQAFERDEFELIFEREGGLFKNVVLEDELTEE